MLGKWTEWNSSKPLFFTVSVMLSFLSRGPWRDVAGARGAPAASGCWVVGQQVRGKTSGYMAAATHPERSLSSVCPGVALGYHFSISLNMIPHTQGLSAMALWTRTRCAPGPLSCQGACLLCMSACPAPCLHPVCMSACWLLSEAHLTDTALRALLHGKPYSLCVLRAWLCSPVSHLSLPLALLHSRGLLPSHPPTPSKRWTGIISKSLVIL